MAGMARWRTLWAALALLILTLGGLLSGYQLLFALWMTAYPKVNNAEWATRFYERLAITAAIGICWISLAIWTFRRKPNSN
jgi:hypothetical protein